MPLTSISCQPCIWLVFLAIHTCMAYQNTNSNTILQQQVNVPLAQTINYPSTQRPHLKYEAIKTVVEETRTAPFNIPIVNIVKQKVPLQYNNETIELVPAGVINQASNAGPGTQFLQTPASSYSSNYYSQQNVKQLLRNIDDRVKNMRNVEMRVAKIQEIFDSMHFSATAAITFNKNLTTTGEKNFESSFELKMENDLVHFSKRLALKLEKALHIVQELRDFFQTNITQIMKFTAEYEENLDDEINEDIGVEPEFDMELNDIEKPLSPHIKPLYLNTFIQSCYERDSSSFSTATENYNKQQIEILNYDKTEYAHNMRNYIDTSLLNENNELTLEANAYIKEKIRSLKLSLLKNELKTNWSVDNLHNNNPKYLGNHIKHIYFLSRSDDASDSFMKFYNEVNFRYLYTSAIQNKYVFLLLDVGSAMSGELLELAKTYISYILNLLSENDLISLVCVSDEIENMILLEASSFDAANGLYTTSRERKEEIVNYINGITLSRSLTNHSLGFEYSLRMISRFQNASLINSQNPIEFVYITRGLFINFSDSRHVLNVLAKGQRLLQKPIVINVCGVVLDEKRIMYEKQFLAEISSQNYTKYNIDTQDWYKPEHILTGKLFMLTKTQQDAIIKAATSIFSSDFRERHIQKTWQVHTPFVEANSRDTIVSITHAVLPFGVVGVDLYFSDLIEDIISYQQQQLQFTMNSNKYLYAFLVEADGNALVHPALSRPSTQNQTPFPVDIQYLENSTEFSNIRQKMLRKENGQESTTIYLNKERWQEKYLRTYQWHNVLGIYILCLVNNEKQQHDMNSSHPMVEMKQTVGAALPMVLNPFSPKNNVPLYHNPEGDYEEYYTTIDLMYHRLDLLRSRDGMNLCRYFRQIATLDVPTLFLSSLAFDSPFTFLHNNRMSSPQSQLHTLESIMAYLKDTTGLLANPGLRPQIRQEVNALYNAMQHLKKRHQDARGSLKNYIIRRYIASVNGVLQVFPGNMLNNNYDPSQRIWYRKALQHPGKIITTEPYLDAGGSGYIITVAHTIFEGKSNALHSIERDQPVAIVAMDLPYAYFYKMILDSTPLCQMYNIKCLLFENEGYLIAHPSMLEPKSSIKNQRRPHEHLTHKESYLANDILNHKNLVRKLACANYQNRTLQRYYVFNTSLNEILTNVVHGERTKYAISLLKGSNIFAAVLNSTCDGGAFCPCSTIDRQCLNCKRMDQSDCECPCECPMPLIQALVEERENTNKVNQLYLNITQQFDYCEPPYEPYLAEPQMMFQEKNLLLTPCVNLNCDAFGTQSDCLAIIGCEWCQQDVDGNGFATSFCSAQSTCFNGVLNGISPYGDLDDADLLAAHSYNPSQNPNTYSAFGPVGGAIIVLAIVIGFAIYCYRQNVDASQDQFYMDSMQEENYGLPLSRFNFDDCQAHDDPPGGSNAGAYDHTAAQRNLMNAADISPYHMSTGSSYRRPPNGESDHGYSTMTPHEDSSDHQCFTLAEPLLLHDKRNSKSDTMSISTSISSPTNRQQQQHQQTHYNSFPSKDCRHNVTSPKKYQSPNRVYESTTLPIHQSHHIDATTNIAPTTTHLILAPVTVHRHMETSES